MIAVDRAVQVHEESYALIEAQHAMVAELRETVARRPRRSETDTGMPRA